MGVRWPWISRKAYDVVFDQCLANERDLKWERENHLKFLQWANGETEGVRAAHETTVKELLRSQESAIKDILQHLSPTNERPSDPAESVQPEPQEPLPDVVSRALLEINALPGSQLRVQQEEMARNLLLGGMNETDAANLLIRGVEVEL